MDIEDRIFELTGDQPIGAKVVAEVVDEYGIDQELAWDLYVKVRKERGTPNRVATKEAIARHAKIRYI